MTNPLIIEGNAFPCIEKSNAKDSHDKYEEDLFLNAPNTLNQIYRMNAPPSLRETISSGVPLMMYCLPYVASYYELDKDDILSEWIKSYTYYIFGIRE